MIKVINIPIEPIGDRYSVQWDRWFVREFSTAAELQVTTVYGGETSGVIKEGAFLDVCETNIYKAEQLFQIVNILKAYSDDYPLVLFFQDLWFPGLEMIAYIRDGRKLKNLRICGCLHAGSYDAHDFLHKSGMTVWASHMEKGWFNSIVDKIFVATIFHKNMLLGNRVQRSNEQKIVVTGFPMYSEEFIEPLTKENTVIFPHRLDAEKQPELFTKLAAQLPEKFSAIKTAEVCANDKAKYYRILNKGKVAISFAKQETWGIAMQEALFCGCIPILPARLSYKELFPPVCLYKSDSDVLKKTLFFLEEYDEMYARLASFRKGLAYKTEHAIENIITQIKCI